MNHQIKLINIHKKRMSILEEQKAKTGVHYNATLEMEITEIKEQILDIENQLKRRLNELLLKSATYGISVDPSVTIEIEDIQEYFGKA